MKWYQKTWAIILFLIIFFPIGLFLMWKYSNWSKSVKGIITGFFILAVLSNIIAARNNKTINTDSNKTEVNKEIQVKQQDNKEEKDNRFIVKDENTSSAVDELILRAKENS